MKSLKFLGFMVLGALVMLGMLLWMSQFYNNQDERIPVIWLNTGDNREPEPQGPWHFE